MRLLYTLLFSALLFTIQAQVSFENFDIAPDSFINEAPDGVFEEEGLSFSNQYNSTYMSFNNFALSNSTDQTTAGFLNQYSVFAPSGANDTDNFAVGYLFDGTASIKRTPEAQILSMMINNMTYPALSMLNGDAYAKKFGGESGNDPDFFLLKFDFFLEGVATGDTLGFYLADFRFEDNSMDYVVQEWTTVDFTEITGEYDEIKLSLKSSDVGGFGMNTPAYVAIDEIQLPVVSNKETNLENVSIYPNPVTDVIQIETEGNATVTIYNILGARMLSTSIINNGTIDISSLSVGTYLVRVQADGKSTTRKVVKK